MYYAIHYKFEAYGDRCLTEDPEEQGRACKIADLLQRMDFPKLDGTPLIDGVIDNCWHNRYATISELSAYTEKLLNECTDTAGHNGVGSKGRGDEEVRTSMEMVPYPLLHVEITTTERVKANNGDKVDQTLSEDHFLSRKTFCLDLEERGLQTGLTKLGSHGIGIDIAC